MVALRAGNRGARRTIGLSHHSNVQQMRATARPKALIWYIQTIYEPRPTQQVQLVAAEEADVNIEPAKKISYAGGFVSLLFTEF